MRITRLPAVTLHRCLVVLLSFLCCTTNFLVHAAMPVVSKVRASQRPGTKLVDIFYDVTGTTNDIIQVSVAVSTNGGVSYTLPAASFSGAGYGASVVPDSNRQIVWDAGADWNSNYSANVSFRVTARDNSVPTGLSYLHAGPFQMGDILNDFPIELNWGWNPELPVHTVYVSAFFIEQFEVTKELWDEVHEWAMNHGYRFEYEDEDQGAPLVKGRAPNHPAIGMSWQGAVKWCNARSEKEGLPPAFYTDAGQTNVYRSGVIDLHNDWVKWNAGYRLPTEAEWEKAARGGAGGHRFSWSDTENISHDRANYFSDTNSWSYDVSPTPGYHPDGWNFEPETWPGTTRVGQFAANGYGLYDMTGNVWEWCWNGTHAGFGEAPAYGALTEVDPRGPSAGSGAGFARALRGGGWLDGALYCRSSYRFGAQWEYGSFQGGFRCVLPGGQPSSIVTAVDTRDIPLTVSGRIRSAQTGAALAGVSVSLGGQTVTTGSDGSYSFPNITLAAGNTLYVTSAGFSGSAQPPQIPGGSVEAMLPDLLLRFASVTNRPVVTDIVARYDGIFLSGIPFQNQYGAVVDWNGLTPGRVEYYINSANSPPIRTVAWSSGSAPTTIEMSQGFLGSYTPGANKLVAVAVDQLGARSDPYARGVVVIPPPAGLDLTQLERNVLFGDGFDPATLYFKVPVPPKNFLGGFDMAMPLLETLGLHLEGEYKLTYNVPSGQWQIAPDGSFLVYRRMQSPYLDWGLWGPRFWANAWANGIATETSGFDLEQVRVQMGIEGEALIFQIHFTDWLPPGPALNQVLDAFAYIGVDINKAQRIDIFGLFGLAADLTWSCLDRRFSEAILTPSGGVKATYGIDLYAASMDTYLQGELAFPIRVTSPQAWKVTGQVSMGLSLYVWQVIDEEWTYVLLQGDIASSGNWDSQQRVQLPLSGIGASAAVLDGVLLKARSSGTRPMKRDYLDAGFPQFLAGNSDLTNWGGATAASRLAEFRRMGQAPVKGSVTWNKSSQPKRGSPAPGLQGYSQLGASSQAELTLLQNVFPFARPAIASRGEEFMLLYVADNGSSNRIQFTDIHWTRWDGTNWSPPAAVHANAQAEFMPQVKYDGNGDAIAVWQRVADPNATNVNVTAQAAQMEIVWARWKRSNGEWSEPLALTANHHLDNAPLLCGPMANGNVLLTWTENSANLLMGTNGPGADSVLWCEWSALNQSWSMAQTLVDGLAYRLSQSLSGAGNTAAYAWTTDGDGVLVDAADQEVFYVTYANGTWTAVNQFTANSVPDGNVRLAVSATGDAYLFWQRETNLVMSHNFSGTIRLARSDSSSAGFADYSLTLGPAGNPVLLWQGMSTNGVDAHYAVYDPISDTWSRDDLLSHDALLERSLVPVWDDVGNLTVAYIRQDIVYTNKTVILEDGGEITLTNAPQRGRADLVVARRALIKDLALEPGDFVASGVNYLPGDPLTLTAVVRNRGNVAVSNVVVSFYDGNPDAGGVLLSNVTLSGWFEAVATNTASAVWVVPEPAAPHVLYAVVNGAGVASEFNESNNVQSVSIGGIDLAVSLLSYRAEVNGSVRVHARVQNLGAPTAMTSVLALRREADTGAPLASVAVPALDPGRSAQVALDLPAGAQPEGSAFYRLFTDDTHANSDVNANNNTVAFAVSLWLDADADGMPDAWEGRYPFLNSTNAADASGDYDDDGMSNLAEYLAGTAPDDPTSYLRLTSITAGNANGVQITWGSAANKFYTIQRTSALGALAFSNIAGHLPSTPPENIYLDTSATNSAAFFYRLLAE